MGGILARRDSAILLHMLEALRLHVDRLYWKLSRRDALEGQHFNLKLGGGACEVDLWVEESGPAIQVKWFTKPPNDVGPPGDGPPPA